MGGHLEIWDWLAASAVMGITVGIVEGECRSRSFVAGPVVGHVLMGSLSGLLAERENPFEERHPRTPSRNLRALKARPDWHTRVRVVTRDGSTVVGKLSRIRGDSIAVAREEGLATIPEAGIRRIDSLGDPIWDVALVSGLAGAGWALLWVNNCDHDPVAYVSRGRMATIGAAIVGATGLALDLLHDGKFVLYGDVGTAHTMPRITPLLHPDGAGFGLVFRF